jgi:hypothetical protein
MDTEEGVSRFKLAAQAAIQALILGNIFFWSYLALSFLTYPLFAEMLSAIEIGHDSAREIETAALVRGILAAGVTYALRWRAFRRRDLEKTEPAELITDALALFFGLAPPALFFLLSFNA